MCVCVFVGVGVGVFWGACGRAKERVGKTWEVRRKREGRCGSEQGLSNNHTHCPRRHNHHQKKFHPSVKSSWIQSFFIFYPPELESPSAPESNPIIRTKNLGLFSTGKKNTSVIYTPMVLWIFCLTTFCNHFCHNCNPSFVCFSSTRIPHHVLLSVSHVVILCTRIFFIFIHVCHTHIYFFLVTVMVGLSYAYC